VVVIKFWEAFAVLVGFPGVADAAFNVVMAWAERVVGASVEVGSFVTAEFVFAACAVLVGIPLVAWAAFLARIAEAESVFLPGVFRAALSEGVAFTELVGQVVVAWAALVALVALAEGGVCSPGIVVWSLGAALFQRIARAILVGRVNLTKAALKCGVTHAGIVLGPGLAGAAERVRLHAKFVLASSLAWAALFKWIARRAMLRVSSPGLAGAAEHSTVALAIEWVGDEGVSFAAINCAVARWAEGWIVSPGVLWAAFNVRVAILLAVGVSPVVTLAAEFIRVAEAEVRVRTEVLAWAASLFFVARAMFWVGEPVFAITAVLIGVANAVLVHAPILTITAELLRVASAKLV
jgi:hypothetical protein